MNNLSLRNYVELPFDSSGDGGCEVCGDNAGNIMVICGRSLSRFVLGSDTKGAFVGSWDSVGEIFDLVDDRVVNLQSTFNGFCAISMRGQIVTFQASDPGKTESVGNIFGGVECAAWSPDLELFAVITTTGKLVLTRETFSVIKEQFVECEELGEKSAITVGWGNKETQFHGSEGKKAAKAVCVEKKPVSDTDDRKPSIVWRNDGQYFATNTVFNDVRTIRIWSREGVLQNTAEAVPQLHKPIAWRWGDENLITAVDYLPEDGMRIIFFETNGLRHGEFILPSSIDQVKQISQGTLSSTPILTLLCSERILGSDGRQQDVLLLYMMSNYQWFIKQTLVFTEGVRAFFWDSKGYLRVVSDCLYSYRWISVVDATDQGRIAIVDKNMVLLTDLEKLVLPPPMAQQRLVADRRVNAVVLLEKNVLVLLEDGAFAIVDDSGVVGKVMSCGEVQKSSWSHLTKINETLTVAVGCASGVYQLYKINILTSEITLIIDLDEAPEAICAYVNNVHIKIKDKILCFNLDVNILTKTSTMMGDLDQLKMTSQGQLIGFSSKERCVYISDKVVSSKASSFLIHGHTFVLITTFDNQLECIALFGNDPTGDHCSSRNVESGSLLLTSAPSDGRVILQLPRGNLETIYPRSVILHTIHSLLISDNFGAAFRLLRLHRVNMNLLYDYDPDAFPTKVSVLIRQIHSPVNLNLFILDLSPQDVSRTMYEDYYALIERNPPRRQKNVREICDMIREALTKISVENFFLSILTCYAKQDSMDDLEAALKLAERMDLVEEGVKYLNLLVSVNQLMDVALGSYDFTLFLRVAQYLNKDPKECLSLVNEFKEYKDDNYRRFKIDMHLKRYDRALISISKCGSEYFSECTDLIVNERLYTKAHSLFPRDSVEAGVIWTLHGDYLLSKKYFKDAGIAYMQAKAYEKACQSFELSISIELCLQAARLAEMDINSVVKRLVLVLTSAKRYSEAGGLMKRFNYTEEKIALTYIAGNCWESAYCTISTITDTETRHRLETELYGAIELNRFELREAVKRDADKFAQYVDRLKLIREQKAQRRDDQSSFFDDGDSPMSDAGSSAGGSMRSEPFSNRSGSFKSGSITTRQSNRQARRNRAPRYSLKEGSPYEDLAIIRECVNLVKNIGNLTDQVAPLVTVLQLRSQMEDACTLQDELASYVSKVKDSYLSEVWPSEGIAAIISDPELQLKPSLPEQTPLSAIFSSR